jgi:hypothetical protein
LIYRQFHERASDIIKIVNNIIINLSIQMAQNYSVNRTDPSAAYQIRPVSSQPFGGTNGIECLRMLDSLFVKQIPSLTEGKLSKQ